MTILQAILFWSFLMTCSMIGCMLVIKIHEVLEERVYSHEDTLHREGKHRVKKTSNDKILAAKE